MKIQKLPFVALCLLFVIISSCATKRLTVQDVNKKVEIARKANMEAEEKSKEAINARNQYTSDYKATQIEKIDKRIKNIDKQMKSIEKSAKNDANETVTNSLKNATAALEEEKDELSLKRKDIQSIRAENWQDNIAQIDSVMTLINDNLIEVETSLTKLNNK